jgi:hypothetical protein
MKNFYKNSSQTPQGAIADMLAESNKNKMAQNYKVAQQKNEFQKQFVLQNLKGNAEWQREQIKMENENKQKELDRQAKAEERQSKNKIKPPSMGEMMMLSTGKIPEEQKAKFGISGDDETRFISNLAAKHGWTPQEVPDSESASNGFLGFGAHAPTKTKIVFSPPQGQTDGVDTNQDEQP